MLAEVFSWWLARMRELLPPSLMGVQGSAPDGIVVETGNGGDMRAFIRRKGREQPLTLGAVPRLAGRRPILLRATPAAVLEKTHVMPAASRTDMDQMLRLELGRITPFNVNDVYWQWNGRPKPNDRTRSEIHLTIVPKLILAPTLDALDRIGIRPKLLEVAANPVRILPLTDDSAARSRRHTAVKILAWTSVTLGICAVVLPFAMQAWELYKTQLAMDALQPAVARV